MKPLNRTPRIGDLMEVRYTMSVNRHGGAVMTILAYYMIIEIRQLKFVDDEVGLRGELLYCEIDDAARIADLTANIYKVGVTHTYWFCTTTGQSTTGVDLTIL